MSSNLPSGPPSQSRPPPSTPSTNILTDPPVPIPTFNVHLVLPFSISPTIFSLPNPEGGQKPGGQGRAEAEGEIKESYKRLVETLHGAGLRVTARRNEKGDEVLLMVGAGGRRIAELAARERREDFLHSLPSQTRLTPYPTSASPHQTPDPENKYLESIPRADQIRYLKELILTNSLQGGLGITPGEGHWRRVRSCLALHDEQANHAWVTSWLTQRWYVGLNKTLGDQDQQIILQNYGPSVAMYFSFLSFYTTSLLPLSVIGTFFWLGSKGVYGYIATLIGLETWAYTGGPAESGYGWSFSPLYSLLLCLWGIAVSEGWRIKQRKLSVSYGTYRISNVSRLRSQYLASLPGNAGFDAPATTANHALHDSHSVRGDPTFLAREGKIVVGVLVVMGLGLGLAGLLSGIFLFEAFLSKLYDGPGKQVLGLVPTLMFVGVVPNVLAFYHSISDKLTNWENHPTKSSHRDSLTVKTFALNAIVAYLGLFLSAYVYVPFGEIIMSYFSDRLFHHTDVPVVQAEKTGMGPKIDIGSRTGIKADRLVGQVFAYTVTNQAINAFTELGLPYLKQYYAQYKGEKRDEESGKKTGLELKRVGHEGGPEEKRFLDKVEKELGLVEYSNFTDYAEMITQFGYITVWSVVWPLAPLFALINNWVELRSDAAKICTQVRRPVAERVESIGPWLHVMSFITWLSFMTTCTLCYLFRPNLDMPAWDQSINPSTNRTTFSNYGTGFLHAAIEDSLHANPNRTVAAVSAYLPTWVARSGAMRTVLPMAIPTMFVALLASHGYLVVRLAGRMVAEKLFWESSAEAKAIVLSEEAAKKSFLEGKYDDGLSTLDGRDQGYGGGGQPGGVRLGAPLGGNDGPSSGYTTTLGAHPGYTTTGGSASGFWRGVDEGYEAIAAALKNE